MKDASLTTACQVRQVDAEKVTHGQGLLLDDESYATIAETFRALADTNRSKIVHTLLQQELCVCDIAAVVGISESATSQHLRILRNLRVVKSQRNGRMIYYTIDDDHIRVLLGVCLRHLGHEPGAQPRRRLARSVRRHHHAGSGK